MSGYIIQNEWSEKNGIHIKIPERYLFYTKLAIFSFHQTLIKPASGEKMYKNDEDWELCNTHIITKLAEQTKKRYSIIVLESNNILTNGKLSINSIKKKFDLFCEKCEKKNIAVIGLFTLSNNFCKKPRTGLWKLLDMLFIKAGIMIDKSDSFYVGHLGGRISTTASSKFGRKPKDSGYTDRAFANNIGIRYSSPEEYFMNQSVRNYEYPKKILSDDEKTFISMAKPDTKSMKAGEIYDHIKIKLPRIKQYLIMLIGNHSSGKTTIADNIIAEFSSNKSHNWIRIDNATPKKNRNKICNKISIESMHGVNIILEGMNHIKAERTHYLNVIKNYDEIGIVIIIVETDIKICKHLDMIRLEKSNDFDEKPKRDFKYSKYLREQEISNFEDTFAELDISKDRYFITNYKFIPNEKKYWNYVF